MDMPAERSAGERQSEFLGKLESNDARKGPKSIAAAPSHPRPHARLDPRALRLAVAFPQDPPAGGRTRRYDETSRLGCDLRQGVRPGGQGRTDSAHALRQMALAELL